MSNCKEDVEFVTHEAIKNVKRARMDALIHKY